MRITFVLPAHSVKPAGGPKVVYEYANRLSRRGHTVTVVHPKLLVPQIDCIDKKAVNYLKYIARRAGLKGGYKPSQWFTVDPTIRLTWVPYLSERFIPDADIIVATYWQTAEIVAILPISKGIKYYFIQHDERVWDGVCKKSIEKTWELSLNKIVIAKWLIDVVRNNNNSSVIYISNGLNFIDFGVDVPIKQRKPQNVIMLYHKLTFKGTIIGIQAIERVKREIPNLSAVIFGVDNRPKEIPGWIEYYQNPNQKRLRSLYNNAAIYVGPSLCEGWGLTGSEAAQCGAALCMTDVGGHREYAIHGETALLCPPGDSLSLANNLMMLIKNDVMRIGLAEAAHQHVKRFDWDRSVDAIERTFHASLCPSHG